MGTESGGAEAACAVMGDKPLGCKAYGSTPHLIGSRVGAGDHHVHQGQHDLLTVKANKGDRVIVTEKLDGSNVAIAMIECEAVALVRAGYLATSSPHEQHHMFARWVHDHAYAFVDLEDGDAIHGEWLAQAHGTRYQLRHGPFVAFAHSQVVNGKRVRGNWSATKLFADVTGVPCAHVVHDGGALSVMEAQALLGEHGHHGAVDFVEGAVWRLERNGAYVMSAKWVDPRKEDGRYLPNVSGVEAVWNWRGPVAT